MYPYERCHRLFAEYPLAAEAADESGLVHSMVLLLADGGDASFFMLVADDTEGQHSFSLFPWNADGSVDIGPGDDAVPSEYAAVLTDGIPVPRDGSLFGWVHGDAVNALIGIQAEYTPTTPVPSWTAMPLADSPAAEWPPFTRDHLLGSWFWKYHRTGPIVSLDGLIADTSGLVFWVDTRDTLGSGCYAVGQDIKSSEGYTLRRGRYVYHEVLLAAQPIPALGKLLANPAKADLGPRFQLWRQNGKGPPVAAHVTGLESRRLNCQ
jgi:hypothetical protein